MPVVRKRLLLKKRRQRKVIKKQVAPKKEEKLIKEIYFDALHPASFGGVNKLAKASDIDPKSVLKWLNKQWSYSLHKPTRQKFQRRKYVTRGVNEQWQADLVEMQHYSRENEGYRYILCAIDIFSRYAYARPLKSKSGPDVAAALEHIFLNATPPKYLQTDQGLEFYNQHVKRVLDEHHIELFSVYSEKKAAIVERFQRTLQEKLYRAFTYQGNYRWLELLPQLIESYNHSYHRTIKTMPANVSKKNETEVWLQQYANLNVNAKAKFSVGDRVRIPKTKTIFTKGYIAKWSDEVFIISEVNTKYNPPVYTLKDENGDVIKGSFYEQELQQVPEDNLYRIEKIMRTRTHQGKKQALVKWKGYTEPSWIDYSQVQTIA